ncbi:hypothetical protein [Nocardia sp. CC227C]|uniref:hypothetical protein n=1 Tax=Nocardia sp. CC227C TaxID=3044562 RepID=UPI00278C3D7E|nr:hypothetical protein [Nocardia sp. CC227C]
MQDNGFRLGGVDPVGGLGSSAVGQKNLRLATLMAERGISAKSLAARMQQYSEQDGGQPVRPKHTNITRYIAGTNRPKQRSIDVMVGVLSVMTGQALTAADIGYPEEPKLDLAPEVKAPTLRSDLLALPFDTVDSAFVEHLKAVLDAHARMDALTGPRYIIGTLQGELQLVEDLCGKARGAMRPALLEVSTRFCEFAGWLYQDSGDLKCAQYWTNRAMDYAEELGDAHLRSYVLQRKSNIATDCGNAAQGLGLANAALRNWDEITPELRAVALRQRANAYAMTREVDECREALDKAMEQVITVVDPSPLALYCTPSYIEMEAAHSWVRLGQPVRAIETYAMGLNDWPDSQRRDQGLCTARLASAYVDAGEFDAAGQAGLRAARLIRTAPSARSLGVLRALAKRVRPVRNETVREFEAAATDLLGR